MCMRSYDKRLNDKDRRDGLWNVWAEWGECSASCGPAVHFRFRNCSDSVHNGTCNGAEYQSGVCHIFCPVDGKWTDWKPWSDCSATCEDGTRTRIRNCSDPAPLHGGDDCKGISTDADTCSMELKCPIDGAWSSWLDWTACDLSCGGGRRLRIRQCNNPAPQYNGSTCPDKDIETEECNTNECPRDGQWSAWFDWDKCSSTCGNGVQNRFHTCTNPKPGFGGSFCSGPVEETRTCSNSDQTMCDVNGDWNDWMEWTTCSVTCSEGYHVRSRTCDNPKPEGNGTECAGLDYEIKHCNMTECPVDGGFGTWVSWTKCSTTCGTGLHFRVRPCDSPAPQYGGHNCTGPKQEFDKCTLKECPVDGAVTNWGKFGACSKTCGYDVIKQRTRSCTSPSPQFGGKNCTEKMVDEAKCDYVDCKDGLWNVWAEWEECSASCGPAVHFRFRNCSYSVHNGTCNGAEYQSGVCHIFCPVDGKWTDWKPWSDCSATCEDGTRTRIRNCSDPAPLHGGDDCKGISTDADTCSMELKCPIDGAWSSWLDWTACDLSCGGGRRLRIRQCNNPAPQYNGSTCPDKDKETEECNTNECPRDGQWSAWFDWDKCSSTCGNGVQNRFHTCTNPKPGFGGSFCSGPVEETRTCSNSDQTMCDVDGQWAAWSAWDSCDVTCGTGTHTRLRNCSNPAPHASGLPCNGSNTDTEDCIVSTPCPVDGGWSVWRDWFKCTVTCGNGTQSRFRTCSSPRPEHGGTYCPGEVEEDRECFSGDCSPSMIVG